MISYVPQREYGSMHGAARALVSRATAWRSPCWRRTGGGRRPRRSQCRPCPH